MEKSNEKLTEPKKNWCFVINSITCKPGESVVRGCFILHILTYIPTGNGGYTEELTPIYLNNPKDEVVFTIADSTFRHLGINLDSTTSLDSNKVYDALETLFRTGYEDVPPAPLEIPLHKIAPSKRDEVLAAIKSQGMS